MVDANGDAVPSRLIVVGDLHGFLHKTQQLWQRLSNVCGDTFETAKIVWLGDYVDRGPQVRELLDWLVHLPASHPHQSHVFLAGNHEMAMGCLLKVWDVAEAAADAAVAEYASHSCEAALYGSGPAATASQVAAAAGMHLQGRRWANAGDIYEASQTFESYGVRFPDRDGLLAALPESHKTFLRDLAWVHECELPAGCAAVGEPASRLVAVHAGLRSLSEPSEPQLRVLRGGATAVLDAAAAIPQLSGRGDVLPTPRDLNDAKGDGRPPRPVTLLVSGHHGMFDVSNPTRMLVDSSAGRHGRRIGAVVFPGRTQVFSDPD